jgi:AcrR family transcriptional regulator
MTALIRMQVNPSLYLRDPEETDLGRRLVAQAILLIEKLGFEKFTFKKLAEELGSTEASMYRYFESKHKLLSYLLSWYWSRMDYLIDYQTNNIQDPVAKLHIALEVLTQSSGSPDAPQVDDPANTYVNEAALHHIVTLEATKTYVPKDLRKEDRESLVTDYERLCERIAKFIREIDPAYKHPKTLVTAIIHTIQRTSLYTELYPSLTEIRKGERREELRDFVEHLSFSALGIKKP